MNVRNLSRLSDSLMMWLKKSFCQILVLDRVGSVPILEIMSRDESLGDQPIGWDRIIN